MMNIAILLERAELADAIKRLLKSGHKANVTIKNADSQDFTKNLLYINTDIIIFEAGSFKSNAYEVISRLKLNFPALLFMMIAEAQDGPLIESFIQGDLVNAFLPVEPTKKELFDALSALQEKDIYYAKTIVDILTEYRKQKRGIASSALKKRELEIMRFLLENKSVQQISDELIISEKTIEQHRKNIYHKANAHSIDELQEFASRQKLLD